MFHGWLAKTNRQDILICNRLPRDQFVARDRLSNNHVTGWCIFLLPVLCFCLLCPMFYDEVGFVAISWFFAHNNCRKRPSFFGNLLVIPSIVTSRVILLYVVCFDSWYRWGMFMHPFILSRRRFMCAINISGEPLGMNSSAPASSTAISLAGSPWEVYTMCGFAGHFPVSFGLIPVRLFWAYQVN